MRSSALLLAAFLALPPARARADAAPDGAPPAASPSADGVPVVDAAPAGPGDIQGKRQEINQIEHEIKKNRQVANSAAREEHNVVGKLEQLARELEAARRDARTHQRNLDLVHQRQDALFVEMGKHEAEEQADRAFLKADLLALYKARNGQGPALLFSARTPAELGARARYLAALGKAALRRVDSLTAQMQQLSGYKREYDQRASELKRRVEEVESDQQRERQERDEREARLKVIRSRKALAVEAVRELQQTRDHEQSVLDSLVQESVQRLREERAERAAEEREREAERKRGLAVHKRRKRPESEPILASGPTNLHGRLPWPVEGKVLSRFGKHLNKEFNTPVFNRGIEISAEEGSTVRAVAAGIVRFAGEMEGFGELVVLDHGGGMLSVYGYGSQVHVQKDQQVEQGAVLEDVGESLAGQASLYFEIRQGVKAMDPLRYLARR